RALELWRDRRSCTPSRSVLPSVAGCPERVVHALITHRDGAIAFPSSTVLGPGRQPISFRAHAHAVFARPTPPGLNGSCIVVSKAWPSVDRVASATSAELT